MFHAAVIFSKSKIRVLTVLLVSSLAAQASAQTKGPSSAASSLGRLNGSRIITGADGSVAVFGAPLISGSTPEKAAAAFLEDHETQLGAENPDLRLLWSAKLGSNKGTVFAYGQYISGLPVENAAARILVSTEPRPRVLYAAARLATAPGSIPDGITSAAAMETIRGNADFAELGGWTQPELVIYAGEPDRGRQDAETAWKFSARSERGTLPRAYTFFVSAASGRLLFARNEIYHAAITGRVTGMATPGTGPDVASNAPAEMPIRDLHVRDDIGTTATTSEDGDFELDGNGAPVQLSAVLAGPFAEVHDFGAAALTLTQPAQPPGPSNFLFNAEPEEASTAQVNAVIQTNRTHAFFKKYQPDFDELDRVVTSNVNESFISCNAFYTPVGHSMNFFAADARCVNTAYSSVINHEYGHFIVNRLQLTQGSFGEGYADTVALMVNDHPLVGEDFFGPGTAVRDIAAANEQYPCRGEIHLCGQVLAGVWWDIKLNLQQSLGQVEGLERARQLFTDWSLITLGGQLRNSAHPGTAAEVLTVDDDDFELDNGTPHMDEVCSAFADHGIPCPGQTDCGNVSLRLSCRRGQILAGVRAAPNSPVTLLLDGQAVESGVTSSLGRAFIRLPATAGQHEVCVEGCETSCTAISCE